ncbi:protein DGCR14, partial [Trichinella spiralis]|uniref:protein DGCR14 n=1 Tax=Trichinella spiralis TaxID=6334 RepID=UPI0001EFE65B
IVPAVMSLIPKPSGELKLNSDPGPSKRRDFFPDINDLKLKNPYMDALAEHDVVKIKELQKKMLSQRNKTTDTESNLHIFVHSLKWIFLFPLPAPIKGDPWELECQKYSL